MAGGEIATLYDWSESSKLSTSRSESDMALNDKITYEKIHERRTGGYPFFASPRAAGVICCSSKCPDGFILVITKVKGTPLQGSWAKLSAKNKEFVYVQVRSAIHVLRTVGIAWADPGRHNILFDEDDYNPSVSVIDFERIELCEDEEVPLQPG
ncbi:hypothetical protein N7471_000291 [Penicillium samsonianum]|uniref:uncharacterized protein n=1 Tax=Penicillium samsonianum TaxID=1882272 RepID=UPI0025487768|nr:uncharacterized protein N7471_000291 [Penicillium samsonianum]KAJ6149092.1 hypothetical protein N7471_000291 [Penicillium samsonianum]